jgi:iron(III) transport system substrate-binding protein
VVQHDPDRVCRTTGIKVNMSLKGSGEALAQLIAERANPKTDVWFGGTGDPHLQAAEQGLALEYKSPRCRSLHPGRSSRRSKAGYKTVGIYSGPLGFGYNTELLAKKKLPRCRRAGPTCSTRSTRARSRSPTRRPAAPPTP